MNFIIEMSFFRWIYTISSDFDGFPLKIDAWLDLGIFMMSINSYNIPIDTTFPLILLVKIKNGYFSPNIKVFICLFKFILIVWPIGNIWKSNEEYERKQMRR